MRNVQVRALNSDEVVAGFYQHGSVTVSLIYDMLHWVCQVTRPTGAPAEWALFNSNGGRLAVDDDNILPIGDYTIRFTDGSPCIVELTTEQHRPRTKSGNSVTADGRVASFKTRIRARDRRCLLSGRRVIGQNYQRHIAAHIFPHAHQTTWAIRGFADQITDQHPSIGQSKINSVQNGMLLSAENSLLWDAYMISIHPVTHRIIHLTPDVGTGVTDGAIVDFSHCANDEKPLDSLLREHLIQCVLAHVKGAGTKPEDFDYDFGEGEVCLSDEQWVTGTGREMLEIELSRRLPVA